MISEGTGIATGNDRKARGQRVTAAMRTATTGVNDPDVAKEKMQEARQAELDRIKAEERKAHLLASIDREKKAPYPNAARIAFLNDKLAELRKG